MKSRTKTKMAQGSPAQLKRRPARAATAPVSKSARRAQLRERLIVHLNELGYTVPAPELVGRFRPELRRRNPYRGSLVYGATLVAEDLNDAARHERLVFFANRRTTKRAAIQLYIAVEAVNLNRLEALLERLEIRTHARGGNVQLVVADDA